MRASCLLCGVHVAAAMVACAAALAAGYAYGTRLSGALELAG